MKNITILLLALLIFSKDIYAYSPEIEAINKADRAVENFYQTRADNCQEYAQKHQGKYDVGTIYKTCCMMMDIDFSDNGKFPPENLKRMNRILSTFKKGEDVCGKGFTNCLKKYLEENSANYHCNK